ncbi:MAG TPA: alpha/beta fold hydrolase, partial [Bacteroidota bacterium]
MERVEFINSRGLRLVGNYHRAGSGAGVVLAHGFTSDKSAVGRFDSLSPALHKTGYSVLAFDFSGCGESDAEILAAHNMVDDLRCAIDFVKNNGCSRVALYGHSLGGLICL